METLPISVLLLARDEASRLAVLLPRLDFASEVVVVVDSASRDDTSRVASAAGARVFERALEGFGAQRQFALARCREPWVLWLDADEVPDEAALAAIRTAVRSPGEVRGFRLLRRGWFMGRRMRFCGWQDERITRLFRREGASFDDAPVHERLRLEGPQRDLDGVLEHHSYESFEVCRTKLVDYARRGAESARRRGRRAAAPDLVLRPLGRFVRQYVLQLGVLDGGHGLALCLYSAAQVFLREFELWSSAHARS
ncbi:MAG: glycosyltransferase family 2 protein [Candidatus Eisenbacteria bacterium]|uniref:Glycosyltransferase family 2 protein n=1 Tax=Eiseniibacteriota bacterium TaxID=2212470 RepID=A0A849SF19_UNCEI|nr:glycosyltransferase family 2 protein [Candidatus Eisenbacteria bacterium]